MNFLFALLLGPFNFFRFSIREGLIALLIPFCLFMVLLYTIFDGSLKAALNYYEELAIWGSIYWGLCIVMSLISGYEQMGKQKYAPLENQANSSMKQWLQQNPGKTVNDYYSKFPV